MKVYVIFGNTGEYDAYRDWMVKGFSDKDVAKCYLKRLKAFAKTLYKKFFKDGNEYYHWAPGENPHDPHFEMDDNGTNYIIAELDVD